MSGPMDKSLVFISHATADKNYAESLADYIELTIENTKTFVASAPESIPSGCDWFREILHNLAGADALAIVYSRNARSSLWLGFELGYFWRKHDGKNIHCLFDPTIELPSPLNERQGKEFTDVASTAIFFRGLARDLSRNYEDDQIAITRIVDAVPKYDEFARWKSLLQNGKWLKRELSGRHANRTVWTSVDETSYQIQNTYEVEVENFKEPWVKGFPDPQATSYIVDLTVSGQTVTQVRFVSLDGGRYFVPMPDIATTDKTDGKIERIYSYERASLKYLVGNIVGRYYSFVKNLDEFAARQGIEIK